jgi:hypothetical protein
VNGGQNYPHKWWKLCLTPSPLDGIRYVRTPSWREHIRRLRQLRQLSAAQRRLGWCRYTLMHRVLWTARRHTLRLRVRGMKVWLAKHRLDANSTLRRPVVTVATMKELAHWRRGRS